MPKKRPMPTEKLKEMMIGAAVMTVWKRPDLAIARAIPTPQAMPRRPPMTPMTTDSMRNCIMMFWKVAPSALRMPISRVRSVTETIMIFMIPMPPTMSEMAAILPRKRVSMVVVLVMVSMRHHHFAR